MIIPTTPQDGIFAAEPVTDGPYKDILKGYRGQLVLFILRRNREVKKRELFHEPGQIVVSSRHFLGLLHGETLYKVPNCEVFDHIPLHEYDLENIDQAFYLPTAKYYKLPELLSEIDDNTQSLFGNMPLTPDALEHINETAHVPMFLREHSQLFIGDKAVCDWAVSNELELKFYILALRMGKKIPRFQQMVDEKIDSLICELFSYVSMSQSSFKFTDKKVVLVMNQLYSFDLSNYEIRKKLINYSRYLVNSLFDKLPAAD